MVSKATAERLVQLSRAAAGQTTKRPVKDILKGERTVAGKYAMPSKPVAPEPVQGQSEGNE
jgi:hypothetical protein